MNKEATRVVHQRTRISLDKVHTPPPDPTNILVLCSVPTRCQPGAGLESKRHGIDSGRFQGQDAKS